MSDWTSGYVADIGYTYGYYEELNPLRVKLAFLNAGLACPEFGTACELGFGQGVSVNLHAAASVTSWHGTDFNPAQAGYAQELAAASGANAHLYDEAFADFSNRQDLPEFDYIGLHGIWSWISDENRAVIVEFIRKKLKVGGVLYISYNTLPGWGTFAPMRHLMTQHAEVIGADGVGIVSRIDGALEFTEKLLATEPLFSKANPLVAQRISQIKTQNRHYLAHEYFNRDWHPMHFATMADWLSPAKVTFAASANYLDYLPVINLTDEQQKFLAEIHDPMFRQSVRDFIVNQQFRKDYWVKGARSLSVIEKSEQLRESKFVLTMPRSDVSLKVKGARGDATLAENVYIPILDLLSDHKVKTLRQIELHMEGKGVNFAQVIQAVLVLIGGGNLAAVQDEAISIKAKKYTDKINKHLMLKARGNGDVVVLASPLTGGGWSISRFSQLFLLAFAQGNKKPEDIAKFVWELLSLQGQKIVKEGQALSTPEENVLELTSQAQDFVSKHLPILKALQII